MAINVYTGAGWTKKYVPMYRILKFINKHADAIKSIRGNEILVTTSAWSEKSSQDRYNFNYYKDSCVTKAGGKSGGTIVLGFLN
jgi:mannan endo-1,4-beta-mannosidase